MILVQCLNILMVLYYMDWTVGQRGLVKCIRWVRMYWSRFMILRPMCVLGTPYDGGSMQRGIGPHCIPTDQQVQYIWCSSVQSNLLLIVINEIPWFETSQLHDKACNILWNDSESSNYFNGQWRLMFIRSNT